jgi:putrescine transport system permease protein
LLAFTLWLDVRVTSCLVAVPGSTTLPVVVFSKVRMGVSPDINALATILVTVVAVGVVIAGIAMSRQQKLRDRDAQMALAANQQMIESLKKG